MNEKSRRIGLGNAVTDGISYRGLTTMAEKVKPVKARRNFRREDPARFEKLVSEKGKSPHPKPPTVQSGG